MEVSRKFHFNFLQKKVRSRTEIFKNILLVSQSLLKTRTDLFLQLGHMHIRILIRYMMNCRIWIGSVVLCILIFRTMNVRKNWTMVGEVPNVLSMYDLDDCVVLRCRWPKWPNSYQELMTLVTSRMRNHPGWLFTRSRIHERTISLRFLGIILRVFRLEISVYNVYITNQFQTTFAQGVKGVKSVSIGACE